MNDHEIERLIRDALSREADRAADKQPPLRLSMRRLAVRTERADDATQLAREAVELQPVRAPRLATNLAGLAAVLVATVLGVTYLLGPESLLGVAGPLHVSERHAYSWRLPDHSWTATEVPGEWKLGEFLDALSPGSDYFETLERPPRNVLVYAFIASQPIPASMEFDGWVYVHDGVTNAQVPCFQLQGGHEQVHVADEVALLSVYYCADFMGSGVGWATVQVLFAHEGRGYAAYFWPDQEPDTPPMDQVRGAALRWLSTFRFTVSSTTP